MIGELEREQLRAPGPEPALELVLVDPEHAHVRVQHEALADEARRVREPVGEPVRGREEQEPGGADAVAGDDDDVRRLELLLALAVDVDGARSRARARSTVISRTRAPVITFAPCCNADGHIVVSVELLAPFGQPHMQVAGALAGGEVAHRRGADRVGRRPPVPAEGVHALGRLADRTARSAAAAERGGPGRVRRVAGHAGDLMSWSIRS